MQQDEQAPVLRIQIVEALIGIFEKEYTKLMDKYPPAMQVELTEHLCTVMFQLIRYGNLAANSESLDIVAAAEEILLRKYGKHLAPYWNMNFPGYFKLDTILWDRKVFSKEQYNALPLDSKALQPTEAVFFATACLEKLETALTDLMLQAEPADINGITQPETITGTAEALTGDKAFTKARQLLAIHFLLSVGFGLEPRNNADVSSIARLCHLLTGTTFTSLQNSEIYKKYLRLPNIKKGLPYITDLQYIRGYFNQIGLQKVIEAIDQEIDREQKEKLQQHKIKE
jgi:hypothetical protein